MRARWRARVHTDQGNLWIWRAQPVPTTIVPFFLPPTLPFKPWLYTLRGCLGIEQSPPPTSHSHDTDRNYGHAHAPRGTWGPTSEVTSPPSQVAQDFRFSARHSSVPPWFGSMETMCPRAAPPSPPRSGLARCPIVPPLPSGAVLLQAPMLCPYHCRTMPSCAISLASQHASHGRRRQLRRGRLCPPPCYTAACPCAVDDFDSAVAACTAVTICAAHVSTIAGMAM